MGRMLLEGRVMGGYGAEYGVVIIIAPCRGPPGNTCTPDERYGQNVEHKSDHFILNFSNIHLKCPTDDMFSYK